MAKAVAQVVGDRLSACVVNVKEGYTLDAQQAGRCLATVPVLSASSRPATLPSTRPVEGTKQIAQALQGLTERDLVICVISGGGSALMSLPAEGITLADIQALTDLLPCSGATINEMNTVRKHLSTIKGGGLARLAQPARLIALLLSDVVGNPLDVIASGPTVLDTTTFQDAWEVLERYNLLDKAPQPVIERLSAGREGRVAET